MSRTGSNFSVSASADSFILGKASGFFVYILRCSDDSLYVGHTTNVPERVKAHDEGRGALWTTCRRPVVLAYQESHESEKSAIARERQIKRWTHAKKAALINGDRAELKSLAKRRIF